MKLTPLLLLVVFVSATLASPYYLRKQGGTQEDKHERPQSDKGSPPRQPTDGGKEACKRARGRCNDQPGKDQEGREVSDSSPDKAAEDLEACNTWLDTELEDAMQGMERSLDDHDKLAGDIEKCKQRIKECASPESQLVRQILRILGDQNTDEDTKDDICETVDEELEEMRKEGEKDTSINPDTVDRKELRNLLYKLYRLK